MQRLMLGIVLWWTLAVAGPAGAATYDPDLRYRTLVTPHFRVHFHQGLGPLADALAEEMERILDTMADELAWRPKGRTEVVLIDPTDQANGFATAVPYRAITLFVTAPQEDGTLSLYGDWNTTLFTHELTHVLHLETHRGIVTAARLVVGRIASTNAVSPRWMVEGLATLQETNHAPGGRGRNPYVTMIERAAVVDDAFPALGSLDGFQAAVPAGNLRYLFGEDFMRFVADQTGRDVWTRWTHTYGGHIPYLLPVRKVFGTSLRRLYRAWRDDVRARVLDDVGRAAALGVREGRAVSAPGESCDAPAFSPDDRHLIWTCTSPATGNALWIAETDGSGARILERDVGAKTFAWRRDGRAFAYAVTHIVNRFNTWSDLYLYDLDTGRTRPLTRGARARDPAWSPDGRELWAVTNGSQRTTLTRFTVDGVQQAVFTPEDNGQVATPAFHPSGRVAAISLWQDGRRDLWLVDAVTGEPFRRLTRDTAIDRDPAWSPDGRTLFFTSDRTGVPQVHAIDVATERLWQVTNVATGAARPSVRSDGAALAYAQYRATGWEIRLLDLDPTAWIDRGPLPAPLDGGGPIAARVDAPTVEPEAGAIAAWSVPEPPTRRRPGAAVDPFHHPTPAGLPARGVADARDPAPVRSLPHQDNAPIGTYEQVEVDDPWGDDAEVDFRWPVKRYDPSASLLPRYWVPIIGLTPRLPPYPDRGAFRFLRTLPPPLDLPGFTLGGSTGATDPLRRWGWSAWARYRTDADAVGGGASVTINRWLPVFTLSAGLDQVPYTYQVTGPWQRVDEDGDPVFTRDDLRATFLREVRGALSVSWPFTPRSTIFGTYAFTWRAEREPLLPGAYLPSLALRGTIGELTAGYRYSWGQPTAMAVSPEDARTFVATGTVTAPWLGTFALEPDGSRDPVTQVLLAVDWREYLVNPAAPNHVFALRGGVGVAFGGADRFLGNFQLGGNGVGGFRALRGYPAGAARGDTYWLAGVAYRMPLWRVDRGIGTAPAFVRFLSAEFFLEAGDAFDRVDSFVDVFDSALVGTGVELRLATIVGWGYGVDFRAGWGVGLTPGGFTPVDPASFYLRFNAGF